MAGIWRAILALIAAVAVIALGLLLGGLTGSTTRIFALAALTVATVLLAVEALAQLAGKSFLATVILGEDGRTSTSKTFVLMWTLLVGWALVALLIAREILTTHGCVSKGDCSSDAIGFLQLGWRSFLKSGFDPAYLVLLGIPASAAVAANAVTETKVASGAMPVVPITAADRTAQGRVLQIFSSDDGATDIADFQYVIFNLILATYFVAGLLNLSSVGLPQVPQTLLGLTSVSAALYVAKKVATSTQPTITAVFPSYLAANASITIIGTNLTDDPALGAKRLAPQVMINGRSAANVMADPSVANRITAQVPAGLNATGTPIAGSVEVLSSLGFKTPALNRTCHRQHEGWEPRQAERTHHISA